MKNTLSTLALGILCSTFSWGQIQGFNVGDAAPSFSLTDLHGQTHTLSDYEGKYILLDLFAYWCGPCQATAPTINEFYKKYGCNSGDMIVLAFDADGTDAQTQDFEDQHGGDANYPTPTVSGVEGQASDVVSSYNPEAYPTICIIDDEGKFAKLDIWPIPNISTLESAISSSGGDNFLVEQACPAPVSVPEIESIKTIVYPNPSTDNLSILSSTKGETTLVITDLLGKQVFSTTYKGLTNLNIDVSKFESGKYILSIESENSKESQMITVL